MPDQVDDSIAAYTVGIPALQFTLERLAFKRIARKIIEGLTDSLEESGLAFRHATDCALRLIGKFNLIGGQVTP